MCWAGRTDQKDHKRLWSLPAEQLPAGIVCCSGMYHLDGMNSYTKQTLTNTPKVSVTSPIWNQRHLGWQGVCMWLNAIQLPKHSMSSMLTEQKHFHLLFLCLLCDLYPFSSCIYSKATQILGFHTDQAVPESTLGDQSQCSRADIEFRLVWLFWLLRHK